MDPTTPLESEHRHRLLEGMSHAVAAKGYAETTIADIVREAAVSRRTFYEHFQTKADCLIALYEAASHNALKVLRSAIDPARDWQTQVEQAMGAYLGCLAQNPVLMRTLFIEILGLASRAWLRAAGPTRRLPTSCWASSTAVRVTRNSPPGVPAP